MMAIRARARQRNYGPAWLPIPSAAPPRWLRPVAWAWASTLGVLVLLLAMGVPLVCMLHCLFLHQAAKSHPQLQQDIHGLRVSILAHDHKASMGVASGSFVANPSAHANEPQPTYPAILVLMLSLGMVGKRFPWPPQQDLKLLFSRPLPQVPPPRTLR